MRKKNLIIVSMLMIVAIMSIGYAYFATTLNITTTGNISSSWNVKFTAMSAGDANGTKATSLSSSYTDTTATMSVDLKEPGDEMTYELTLTNLGDITAMIEDINAEATGSGAIIFSIDGIKEKDTLAKNETRTIKVKIEFDKNTTSFPSETTKTLTLSIRAVQLVDQDTNNQTNPSIDQPLYLNTAILKNNTAQADTNIDFSKTSEESGTNGLYYTNINTENNGTTYYYRGNVKNNYAKFGNYTQDVCKYNGEYVGYNYSESAYRLPENETECATSTLVTLNNPVIYQGIKIKYMIQTEDYFNEGRYCDSHSANCKETLSVTPSWATETVDMVWRIVRINEDNSIRLIYLGSTLFANDVWQTKYQDYLSNVGFCNDQKVAFDDPADEDGGVAFKQFGTYDRLVTNKKPQFVCTDSNYILKTLIGELTADEASYAGGVYNKANSTYYLNVNSNHSIRLLSMSTYDSMDGNWHFGISPTGALLADTDDMWVYEGIIPMGITSFKVVNLKADTLISGGNGTSTNPYVVKTN